MNGKRIAKIISEEIMKSLYQFSDVITESYKCAPEAETNDDRRFKYNVCKQTGHMRKIDSLKFGGYDKLGFDIEISEPIFNRRENYARDCPCLTVCFTNMSKRSDPKTFAKIILFGFSTDWVYQVHYGDGSDKPEFDVAIDHTEFSGSFNEIKLFFVRANNDDAEEKN